MGEAIAAAMAHESLRDPFTYSWATYLWVIGWAVMGGLANFAGKLRRGEARVFNLAELVGEIFVSGFVGMLTFWLCEYANVDRLLGAVFIGISGHMGSRALFAAERWLSGYVERRTGIAVPAETENGR